MSYNLNRDEIFWMIEHDDDIEKVINLIDNLDKVDFRDAEGTTYLHVAALNHKLEIIKLLLKKGANPNCQDNKGRFAIIYALGRRNEKNPEILKLFLEYGLDLDIKKNNDGLTIKETILSFEDQQLNEIINKFENR